MDFNLDDKLKRQVDEIIEKLNFNHIKAKQVKVFRSIGSTSRARARIYAMPRIWQKALEIKPHYCIEFISENFDHLSDNDKVKVMIHELMHIPKTFSGALTPHRGKGRRDQVTSRMVNQLFKKYRKQC